MRIIDVSLERLDWYIFDFFFPQVIGENRYFFGKFMPLKYMYFSAMVPLDNQSLATSDVVLRRKKYYAMLCDNICLFLYVAGKCPAVGSCECRN